MEVILRAYERWGEDCVDRLRGMFSFAIWDPSRSKLFVARDRFGIKPLCYVVRDGSFYFASEAKALLPFLSEVEIDLDRLHDYFCFQFCLGEGSLFRGVRQVESAHCGYVGTDGGPQLRRYWEVHYDLDWEHTEKYFVERLRAELRESIDLHLRSEPTTMDTTSRRFDEQAGATGSRSGPLPVGLAG